MELRCFGNGKCPDWVLSGLFICNIFDAPDAKTVCLAIAAHAAGEALDEEEIKTILTKYKLNPAEDLQHVMGSVLYVLRTCARWDSDSALLAAGMRTIRISTHMIRALRMAFDEHGTAIGIKMRQTALTLTRLLDVEIVAAPKESVSCVKLNLKFKDCINNKVEEHSIQVQKSYLYQLTHELINARKSME